jgi:hypothetical protein
MTRPDLKSSQVKFLGNVRKKPLYADLGIPGRVVDEHEQVDVGVFVRRRFPTRA